MAQEIGLHNLKPKPGSRHKKKRLGRGEGSGLGKTSGRGQKGAGSRAGAKQRVNFEGGQMPIHMRLRKLRGPHMKKSMPFEQYGRTRTQPVNLKDLDARFADGAEVTPETLREKGLATRRDVPVKVLGQGELTKKLTVLVHAASRTAQEKIEAAGGSVELLVERKRAAAPRGETPPPPPDTPLEDDPAGPDPDDLTDQEQVNEQEASDAEVQPSEGGEAAEPAESSEPADAEE